MKRTLLGLVLAVAALSGAPALAQEERKKAALPGFNFDRTKTRPTVGQIDPDSTATDMGLKVGDVILEFDGKKVKNMAEFVAAFKAHGQWWAGEEMKVRVKRGKKKLRLKAPLRAAPDTAEHSAAKEWEISRWGNLPEGMEEGPTLESLKGKVVVVFLFTST